MLRNFFSIIISLLALSGAVFAGPQPLKIDQAFAFSAHMDQKNLLTLEWQIAPGYHLYRNKMNVAVLPTSEIKTGKIELPAGQIKKDKVLGDLQVYSGTVQVQVPLINPDNKVLSLTVSYQGCSDKGFCYPPEERSVRVKPGSQDKNTNIVITNAMKADKSNEQTYENKFFSGQSDFVIILSFLGIGLLLSFTPCVLPMVPILSGIIVGHGKHITTTKAFFLSLSYVLGMAVTYAIAGMIVALVGSHIQTVFQNTWVIILFSTFFVVLAFSLFGFFEFETPGHWRKRVTAWSHRHRGGTYFGVFMMGALASLILSPCVSAPLVGVLAYIAQTGNVALGGVSLLALGFGMGIPLLLIGASAGKLLPKTGPWMVEIKKAFGILMLATTIWMLSRVLPGNVILLLCALLLICVAIFMGVFKQTKNKWHMLMRGFGIVFLIYGVVLVIGAALGNSDPLHPWEGTKIEVSKQHLKFTDLKSMDQLDRELQMAKANHQPVMIDFYADWCTACVAMQRFVFWKPQAKEDLANFVVLRADVTHNTDFDQAILKRFKVIAPPTMIFINQEGEELASDRIVGEVDAKEFTKHVLQLNLTQNQGT